MIAVSDVVAARAGADELGRTAETLAAPYLRALSTSAAGSVLLAEGDPTSALPILRAAEAAWRELDAPYETARVRVLLGLACAAFDDPETSALELEGARKLFERLGAVPDIQRLDDLTRRPDGQSPRGLTDREVEVLRLVAKELGLSEKTVARHVSNTFAKIDVPSRVAATAYAYQNGLV